MLRRVWWVLLLLGPAAFVGDHLGWSISVVFVLAALGMIPTAALLGRATEEVSAGITEWDRRRQGPVSLPAGTASLGAKVGGLLNATFGNVADLIITVLALQEGYIELTKAAIIGSMIANTSLGLGLAMFVGGARHGLQRFDANEAGYHAVLLAIAVSSLALPTLFLTSAHAGHSVEISVVAAALLLATYLAYILYSIFRVHGGVGVREDEENRTPIDEKARVAPELHEHEGPESWPMWRSIAVLALATLLVFGAAEALVDTVQPFTARFGWSPFFVGIVVVPLIGSAAENSSAILLAVKNKMNVSVAVSAGSSIQIALFVTPILVFLSQLWHHLDLVFRPIEIAALGLVVALFFLVSRDGKSNWLEGLQLIVLYALAATIFFYVPGKLG